MMMKNLLPSTKKKMRLVMMLLAVAGNFPRHFARNFSVSAAAAAASSPSSLNSNKKLYKTLAVQVVHRHGDRSPITPMKDEAFWASTLIPADLQDKIAEGTSLIQSDTINTHNANGRGPFGKLSELGLLQMIKVGNVLREQLSTSHDIYSPEAILEDEQGNLAMPYIWHAERPLHPDNIRVISTDFERTIQSVQGTLVGLFPDGIESTIPIDVRHTSWLIPDPQPRRSQEQAALEQRLAATDQMIHAEAALRPLARRATAALHDLLSPDAHEAAFGVAMAHPEEISIEIEPLAWTQLAEVTKCLALRGLLPTAISKSDKEKIAAHAAWRWFQTLREPRMAHLAMHKLVSYQVDAFLNFGENNPPMTIYSAHDSTLIGLLCAYALQQPAVWPEYASYLMLELIQVVNSNNIGDDESAPSPDDLFVRFSLNGERLKSDWMDDDDDDMMIPLARLKEKIDTHGAAAAEPLPKQQ